MTGSYSSARLVSCPPVTPLTSCSRPPEEAEAIAQFGYGRSARAVHAPVTGSKAYVAVVSLPLTGSVPPAHTTLPSMSAQENHESVTG